MRVHCKIFRILTENIIPKHANIAIRNILVDIFSGFFLLHIDIHLQQVEKFNIHKKGKG